MVSISLDGLDTIRICVGYRTGDQVRDLPPMAAEVSGKVYRLEPNQFDLRCISIDFRSSADVVFTLSVGEGTFVLPGGMDGVPRFSLRCTGPHPALQRPR